MKLQHRVVVLLSVSVVAALGFVSCGGDDGSSSETTQTSVAPTTQSTQAPTTQSTQGGDGGAGTATVTVAAGTFELQLEDACVISEVGIGAVASSNEGSLTIAGPQEIAVVVFELPSGEQWAAMAADVAIDGTTMSYSGPAIGPGADSTIDVQVFCDEVVSLGG